MTPGTTNTQTLRVLALDRKSSLGAGTVLLTTTDEDAARREAMTAAAQTSRRVVIEVCRTWLSCERQVTELNPHEEQSDE